VGGFLGWWVLRALRIYYNAGGIVGALVERIVASPLLRGYRLSTVYCNYKVMLFLTGICHSNGRALIRDWSRTYFEMPEGVRGRGWGRKYPQ
jgi:hypothetical protein